MAEQGQKVRVAVNVMRARLTVVGFNITIIALQLGRLKDVPGGIELPNMGHTAQFEFSIALLLGLALSVLSFIAFIYSCDLDLTGTCDHWSLVAGDLLMYVALAHTVAGFFGPLFFTIDHVLLTSPVEIAALGTLKISLVIAGGIAWTAAMYVGPVVSLLRSPFERSESLLLGIAYLILVVLLAYVSAQAVSIELAHDPKIAKPPPSILNQLLVPLRW